MLNMDALNAALDLTAQDDTVAEDAEYTELEDADEEFEPDTVEELRKDGEHGSDGRYVGSLRAAERASADAHGKSRNANTRMQGRSSAAHNQAYLYHVDAAEQLARHGKTALVAEHRALAEAHRVRIKKDFNPDDHPRAPDGKFGGRALPSLQPHHREALAQYKGAQQEMNAIGLNGRLRDRVPLDDARAAQVRHLDDAFNHHSKVSAPVTLYRGLSDAPQWRGSMHTNEGYTSLSSDPDVADMYSSLTSNTGHVLEVRIPKGVRILGVDQHAGAFDAASTIGEEREYLLPRQAAFRHVSSNGNHHVVEYVGSGTRWSLGRPGPAPAYEPKR